MTDIIISIENQSKSYIVPFSPTKPVLSVRDSPLIKMAIKMAINIERREYTVS